jgi:hypothetical protein
MGGSVNAGPAPEGGAAFTIVTPDTTLPAAPPVDSSRSCNPPGRHLTPGPAARAAPPASTEREALLSGAPTRTAPAKG